MKTVKAVPPFFYNHGCNFKNQPYNAWSNIGGKCVHSHYPPLGLHKIATAIDYPSINFMQDSINNGQARLRFVEANNIRFDTFPDYMCYEIIPIIWDCWPSCDNKLLRWLVRHNVKSVVFTSKEAEARISEKLPQLNTLTITEGIDIKAYLKGKELKDRSIDLFYYGRRFGFQYNAYADGINIQEDGDDNEFRYRLSESKITLAVPRCDIVPHLTGGQETLTQRYWECMLSRIVMIGRSPQELVDLIGYDPVIRFEGYIPGKGVTENLKQPQNIEHNFYEVTKKVLYNIQDYQELVDKNRKTALRLASWEIRMRQVKDWLLNLGYEI